MLTVNTAAQGPVKQRVTEADEAECCERENGRVGAQQGRDRKLGQTHVIRLSIRLSWEINKRRGSDLQTNAGLQLTPPT